MHFYDFPAEILALIFDELDPSFFYDDIGRLTVSKLWYQFALPRFLPELRVKSTQSLLALADNPVFLARAEPVVEVADLTVDGLGRTFSRIAGGIRGIGTSNMNALNDSLRAFDSSYRTIISFLNCCPRLHSLRLRMKADEKAGDDIVWFFQILGGYCHADRVLDTFAVRAGHLSSLVIDLAAGRSSSTSALDPDDPDRKHFCIQLQRVLPSLRKFHCRMDRICPHLVHFDQSTIGDWPLEEIIINLSLQDFGADRFYYRDGERPPCRVLVDCRDDDDSRENPIDSATGLREDFELWMLDLAHNLKNARMVRTIWDAYPRNWDYIPPYTATPEQKTPPIDILAVEAIDCHLYKLQPGDAWDAMGELIDDGQGGTTPEYGPDDDFEDDEELDEVAMHAMLD